MLAKPWFRTLALGLVLFGLNVVLNLPLFQRGDSPYRDSIEAGYMGMSRFITANPSPWGWNPLQYGGLPTQFTYVPALHYATAAASRVTGSDPVYVYRLITATLACLGPVSVFLFVWFFTRSNTWALATALAYTFFSPLYGLIRQVDQDRGMVYLPWRLHVLAKYGESPHIVGLVLLPLALIATWWTATERKYWQVPLAALLMATITLTNWVAGLGLGVSSMVFLLAGLGAPDVRFRFWRPIAAAVLAYGLACFWLTPSFIHTIAFNWPVDSFNYKLQMAQRWLIAGWVVGLIALRLLMWGLRWPFYATFVSLGMFAFGYPVLFFYSYGMDMLPESRRYAPEFEFFVILTILLFLRFCLTGSNQVRRVCAVATAIPLLLAGLPMAKQYVTQGQARWRPIPREQTTEYQLAKWIADQKPRGRVLASGGLRFRLNSWFDLHQVGGSFESGLRNRVPVHLSYQIRTSIGSTPESDAADSIEQMKALGVEYVVIHGPKSDEHYRDYKNPMKFEGVLERVYGDDADYVYRVPFRSLAHLVRPEEQPPYAVKGWFPKYVSAIDDAGRPQLDVRWQSPSSIEVRGTVIEGHDVTLAVTNEEGWVATQDGNPVPVEKNNFNHIVVKARPSAQSVIRLDFSSTVEQRAMAVLCCFVWVVTGTWLWRRRPRASGYHEERWQTLSATTGSA